MNEINNIMNYELFISQDYDIIENYHHLLEDEFDKYCNENTFD